jgi:hypothetical protein
MLWLLFAALCTCQDPRLVAACCFGPGHGCSRIGTVPALNGLALADMLGFHADNRSGHGCITAVVMIWHLLLWGARALLTLPRICACMAGLLLAVMLGFHAYTPGVACWQRGGWKQA